MHTLRSYVEGRWHEAEDGFRTLHDPCTEEPVARASSRGIDFGAALRHARSVGGPALREMTFAQRADLVRGVSKALRSKRDELLELSLLNTGTTPADGSFDVDGGTGTLAYYGALGKGLGDRRHLDEDDAVAIGRGDGFWVRHVLVPKHGVAVCINAFNFPVWGFAEKVACCLLAGVPAIVKPATASAWVAARAVEVALEADVLPPGTLQLVCGGAGDLLDHLGPQDVLAFTGSADTARTLRARDSVLDTSVAVNIEADSLNAAVLGSGAGEAATDLFVKDVVREMTQKTGQKCTAVRRVLVPEDRLDEVRDALVAKLEKVVPGDPRDEATTMGPLASAQQLDDTVRGTAALAEEAKLVHGNGQRLEGNGAPPGKGYFFGPTLLEAEDPLNASTVHSREVFAPVATLLAYDGSAGQAADLVALGGGTLVTSAYSDDGDWTGDFLARAGATTGRLYVGSEASADEAMGSGVAFPQALHGGPGRAGGGQELGGLVGVRRYLQRVALQGAKAGIGRLAEDGTGDDG